MAITNFKEKLLIFLDSVLGGQTNVYTIYYDMTSLEIAMIYGDSDDFDNLMNLKPKLHVKDPYISSPFFVSIYSRNSHYLESP